MNETPYNIPKPENEPIKNYAPGSQENISLKAKITELQSTQIEIPVIISPLAVVLVATGSVLIAVAASLLPARKAARLHPVEALRYE